MKIQATTSQAHQPVPGSWRVGTIEKARRGRARSGKEKEIPLVACWPFRWSSLTESLEQAIHKAVGETQPNSLIKGEEPKR